MPFMRRSSLTKMSRTFKRRKRTSVAKRVKFQKPSARNQKSQIMGNAYAIASLRRLMPPPVYTDYQFSAGYGPFFQPTPGNYSSILCDKLTDLTTWVPVLRQDQNAIASSTTLIKRMQINLRYDLGQSDWVQATTYIVTLRRDAANRDPSDEATLTEGQDFIVSTQQGQNARLNPAVFKVHYVRNVSLMSNSWRQPSAVVGDSTFTSNSALTFAKGQVNLKLNMKVRQPVAGANWKTMSIEQLTPSQRVYILTFFKGSTKTADDDPPAVFYDCLSTCYNSS